MSLGEIRLRVAKACERAGRKESEVSLLAVSKLQSEEKIRLLFQRGQRDFGENYVQELTAKMEALKDLDLRWHLIGHLQRNKVKFVSGRCRLVHSVDSLPLAEALQRKAAEGNLVERILLQVNLAGEASKEGFSADGLRAAWPALSALPNLRLHGLMTMPPLRNRPEENRVHFAQLRKLRDELRSRIDPSLHPMSELSMGTSHDFETAVEEGATWIRVGTLAFGERPAKG